MKRTVFIALLLLAAVQPIFARDGYHVKVKFTDVKDSMVYLAHYYGKGLYATDSARLKNGVYTFDGKKPLLGGIYMILLSDKGREFEFLLNNGDDLDITATIKELPKGVTFKNSPENDRFETYVTFLNDFGKRQQDLQTEFKNARTNADTVAVRKKAGDENKKLAAYRRDYAAKYPGTLLASIFNAIDEPQVPEGKHYLADGTTVDSNFSYTYFKAHFWDGFDFKDDRLINTPIYDGKLDQYFTHLVVPGPDSMEHESDILLAKVKNSKELFHYSLWWLTRNAEASKIMGMDEVFVYLVENYYMKGYATWLSNDELTKYIDRASKIAPNVIGNVAPEIKLPNVLTKQVADMSAEKAKYTLLVFYSPECGHCQIEMPKLDSVYEASLKSKGLRVYTVSTEGDDKKIGDFLKKNKLTDWTNTYDPEHVGDWRAKYDVYSTPTIYLLDDKKIIRGKRLDHSNIGSVIEMLEKQNKTTKRN